ncbi:MAG: hypothetical protein FJ318_00120 [SAR202 cluster bacterium]|nr:hypothetical protein [SAR202 cluster bacterium]
MAGLQFIGLFIPLFIIATIIAGIVVLARRDGGPSQPGIGTVRRLFFYGLAFVGLMLTASGVNFLASQILEELTSRALAGTASSRLALGLAAVIVGTPLWLIFWLSAQRSLRAYPAEAGTLARKLYLNAVLFIAAVVAAIAAVNLLQGAFETYFDASALATLLTWVGIWLFHWRVESGEGQPSDDARVLHRLYANATTVYALALIVFEGAAVIGGLLSAAYDALFTDALLFGAANPLWTRTIQESLALAAVGGAWWWLHWHRMQRADAGSMARLVVLYVVAIATGMAMMVAAASLALYNILRWIIAPPPGVGAAPYFSGLPDAIALAVAGAALWGYHIAVVRQEAIAAQLRSHGTESVYRYLMAAVGLSTFAVGLVVLFAVVIGLVLPEGGTVVRESVGGGASIGLTLLIVGAPLWAIYWFRQQRIVQGSDVRAIEEREALPRRVFIFLVFGIALLATIGALSSLLYGVFRALLDGDFSTGTIYDGRWQLGVVLMAGAIGVYYWLVLREDRETVRASGYAPPQPAVKRVIVVASQQSFASAIAQRIGAPVQWWQSLTDGALATEATLDEAARGIRSASGDSVLVVIDSAGTRVIPYRQA